MTEAEKAARLCTDLDRCSVAVEYDLSKSIAEKMHEAAALIEVCVHPQSLRIVVPSTSRATTVFAPKPSAGFAPQPS